MLDWIIHCIRLTTVIIIIIIIIIMCELPGVCEWTKMLLCVCVCVCVCVCAHVCARYLAFVNGKDGGE